MTVDSAGPGVARARRRGPAPGARAELRPRSGAAPLLCGPEVMMRFTVAALAQAGVGRRAGVRVDGAQHAVRHRPLRALPARAHAGLPRRPGVPLERARALARDQGAVMEAAATPDARRVEVLLLRRLPAQPARPARTSCCCSPTASRSPTSWRRAARSSRAPTTSRSSRARSPRPTTPNASTRFARARVR